MILNQINANGLKFMIQHKNGIIVAKTKVLKLLKMKIALVFGLPILDVKLERHKIILLTRFQNIIVKLIIDLEKIDLINKY